MAVNKNTIRNISDCIVCELKLFFLLLKSMNEKAGTEIRSSSGKHRFHPKADISLNVEILVKKN